MMMSRASPPILISRRRRWSASAPHKMACNSVGAQSFASSVRVLGVDPGTIRTGWGVIERKGRALEFRAAGVISTRGFHSLPERLRVIYTGLVDLIHDWSPQVLSLEKA